MDCNAYQRLQNTIIRIKEGDDSARETLINEYKPFILKTVNRFCRRMLTWGCDEELSIGLIAFNTAVDAFNPDKNIPFLAFSRVVILNRLKDYARREGKYRDTYQLDDEAVASSLEGQIARDDYVNKTIEDDRREEIQSFEMLLSAYSIGFEDLVEVSPRHRDYRITLLAVACKLAETTSLMEYLNRKKQLPLNELEKICGVKRKTLERGRKFIIASALILNRPDEFVYLRSYIDFNGK